MTSPEALSATPFWLYRHSDSVTHPRPLHVSWDGMVLRAENPWWQTHYPPNGWGCMCKVFGLSAAEVKAQGLTVLDGAPDDGVYTVSHPTSGQRVQVPNGIDFGWDYAPGRTWMPAVEKYPEPLARAVIADYAADGVFTRWHDRLVGMVADWADWPEFSGMSAEKFVAAVRSAKLIPHESLGIAVVDRAVRDMIGVDAMVLRASSDTIVKQIINRKNQPVTWETYLDLQAMLDNASVVVRDSDVSVNIWSSVNGELWYCALKTTGAHDELYLLSLRRTDVDQARSRLSPDQLDRLGVA